MLCRMRLRWRLQVSACCCLPTPPPPCLPPPCRPGSSLMLCCMCAQSAQRSLHSIDYGPSLPCSRLSVSSLIFHCRCGASMVCSVAVVCCFLLSVMLTVVFVVVVVVCSIVDTVVRSPTGGQEWGRPLPHFPPSSCLLLLLPRLSVVCVACSWYNVRSVMHCLHSLRSRLASRYVVDVVCDASLQHSSVCCCCL